MTDTVFAEQRQVLAFEPFPRKHCAIVIAQKSFGAMHHGPTASKLGVKDGSCPTCHENVQAFLMAEHLIVEHSFLFTHVRGHRDSKVGRLQHRCVPGRHVLKAIVNAVVAHVADHFLGAGDGDR